MDRKALSSQESPITNLDPSFAKKYLTRNNYFFDSLHNPAINDAERSNIQRMNEELRERYRRKTGDTRYIGPLAKFTAEATDQTKSICIYERLPVNTNMADLEDDDINRLPESSDEEQNAVEDNEAKSRTGDNPHIFIPLKRKAELSAKPTRSKRGRQQPTEAENTPVVTSNASNGKLSSQGDFFNQLDLSQTKRMKVKAKTFTSSQRSKESFSCPDPISQTTPEKQTRTKDMVLVDALDDQSPIKTPNKFKTVAGTPKSGHFGVHNATFRLPNDFETEEPRGSSQMKSTMLLLDDSFDSPEGKTQERRGSSSSLSSVDSIAEYELSKQDREDLMNEDKNDDNIDRRHQVKCPMCKRVTSRYDLGIYDDPATFSLQRQQKFCHKHRYRDAKSEWQRAGYPDIDWDGKLPRRIDEHKHWLSKVLRREKPSYYLDILNSKIKEAKNNQSQIKHYFDSGVMDIVDQGYYGPRGSKVFTNAIANDEQLRKLFDKQSRSDRTIRIAGFGRLVDSVLLPEIVLRLVMEDLTISDEEKAREILRNSNEVGILLNPGDDYVPRLVDE